MSLNDFRQITARSQSNRSRSNRSERLFRAAVTAFCSLTRPTRREIGQLEDLVLPLFACVSTDARRYVAAALSESDFAPRNLVMRLADERADIAAPILLRSRALSDVDLIALIGRHGIGHARVIARRPGLNDTIGNLVQALLGAASRAPLTITEPEITSPVDRAIAPPTPQAALAVSETSHMQDNASNASRGFGKADAVREQLRAMMAPSVEPEQFHAVFELRPRLSEAETRRLRDLALTGNVSFFETALADAMSIAYAQARQICGASTYTDLIYALKSLEIADDTAFLIVAANYPTLFGHAEAIRIFLERYHLCHPEAAKERVRAWKVESIATTVATARPARGPVRLEGANRDEKQALRRAS